MARRSARGFTLLELIVVTAIMGIIMAIGTPALRDLLANQRIKSASFNLVVSSMFARSEAVKRGTAVTIKAQTSNDLTSGWCVLISAAASCSLSSPDTANTMRVEMPPDGVTYVFRTAAAPITFNRSGRLTNLVKVELNDNQDATLKRCVVIDVGGSARAAVGACP